MGQPARKLTAKDANEKLAHRRLTLLQLAERLGSVAEACRFHRPQGLNLRDILPNGEVEVQLATERRAPVFEFLETASEQALVRLAVFRPGCCR